MRIGLVLAVTVSLLLAFAAACGDDEKAGPTLPSPAGESEGEAEGWEADGAEEGDGADADGDVDGDGDGGPRVSASIDVTPRDSVGGCPITLTFSGTITLESGSGTVSYQIVGQYDDLISEGTLTFDSPGTQDVSATWNRGHPASVARISEWVVIRILEPEEYESNRANFTILCDEGGPEDCPDADTDGVCDDDDDDDDNDGVSDADETDWGSDPLDAASTPESSDFDLGTCHDGVDNDGDGDIDLADDGCV